MLAGEAMEQQIKCQIIRPKLAPGLGINQSKAAEVAPTRQLDPMPAQIEK
jgi:hypothetical protein